MPFAFEHVTGNSYRFAHDVMPQLVGKIVDYLREEATRKQAPLNHPFAWHLPGRELVGACLAGQTTVGNGGNVVLVADVWDALQNPRRTQALFLEVCDIYGFSGWGWTPMMWKLRELYEGAVVANPRADEWTFQSDGLFIYEFLYLQCDHKGGKGGLGPNGSYNGTLLYPEALDYFKKHMS